MYVCTPGVYNAGSACCVSLLSASAEKLQQAASGTAKCRSRTGVMCARDGASTQRSQDTQVILCACGAFQAHDAPASGTSGAHAQGPEELQHPTA